MFTTVVSLLSYVIIFSTTIALTTTTATCLRWSHCLLLKSSPFFILEVVSSQGTIFSLVYKKQPQRDCSDFFQRRLSSRYLHLFLVNLVKIHNPPRAATRKETSFFFSRLLSSYLSPPLSCRFCSRQNTDMFNTSKVPRDLTRERAESSTQPSISFVPEFLAGKKSMTTWGNPNYLLQFWNKVLLSFLHLLLLVAVFCRPSRLKAWTLVIPPPPQLLNNVPEKVQVVHPSKRNNN